MKKNKTQCNNDILSSEDGRSPLFVAAESNHPAVVGMLLDAQADVNRATEDGRTPLPPAFSALLDPI